MSNLDVLTIFIITLSIYMIFNIKNDYREYKKTKAFIDFNILIGDISVILASIILIVYKLVKLL